MPTAIEEVLSAWREAERLLESLPPLDPDHETVRLMVVRLQETYRTLTLIGADTAMAISASVHTVGDTRTLLREIRARRDGSS
jgi:hypothetical protein